MIEGASCSRDDNAAATTCTRCGDFLCEACVWSVANSPLNYCDECLRRRADHLKDRKLGYMHNNKPARISVAFGVLGVCVSVLPFFLVGLPTAVWGMVESRKLKGEGLATAIFGLVISLFYAVLWSVIVFPSFLDSFLLFP
ncbi:MAG: hypothetical protein GY898_29770 [Proteobacteria bacterium]|nr:hypothetical protein [Pseudomonadota bacterium]